MDVPCRFDLSAATELLRTAWCGHLKSPVLHLPSAEMHSV